MIQPIAAALTVATLTLAGCSETVGTVPITDQNYGGKVGAAHSGVVTRGSYRCPDWANVMHRGDLYCLKTR